MVRDWHDVEVLGGTLDDVVGEAFDKAAKMLGLLLSKALTWIRWRKREIRLSMLLVVRKQKASILVLAV